MAWTSLNALILNQTGDYSPLPVGAAGGEINLRIPAFPAGESGTYRVGIYSGTPENPGFIADDTVSIAPYQRHLRYTVPANTSGLFVGLQLLTHEDLPGASYELVPEWQPVNALGQFPGGCQLPLALSLEQVTGLVSGNIAANYATFPDLSALETGVDLAIAATRLELEALIAANTAEIATNAAAHQNLIDTVIPQINLELEDLRAQIEAASPPAPLVPVMTGESAPAPFVARSSHPARLLSPPWRAFDQNPTTTLLTFFQENGGPVRIEVYLGSEKTIRGFSVSSDFDGPNNRVPRLFELQKSEDGLSWETIATFDESVRIWHRETKTYSDLDFSTSWIGLLFVADYGANAPEVSAIQFFGLVE